MLCGASFCVLGGWEGEGGSWDGRGEGVGGGELIDRIDLPLTRWGGSD